MKHTHARNVIERTFGLLKMRWGILRSPSWYPIKSANKIITACCLLHNYIRNEMLVDPPELELDEYLYNQHTDDLYTDNEFVDSLDATPEWTAKRDEMALTIWMDPMGNQTGPCADRVKCGRGHRSWSKIEEDALIVSLTKLVLKGWKSDNSFKAGFQHELEKCMRKKIPSTDLVANPHINSKIHVWNKEYGALSGMLSKSGIGWNSTTSMLEIEDERGWDSYVRADPHVKGLRYKTWPYYSQWIEIFGKDRATGENVVDPIDIVNELPTDVNPKLMPKAKKRKTNDSDISMLVDSLGDFMKFSKNAMTDLYHGAEMGVGSSNDTKQLNLIMKGIVSLKLSYKLKVCDELVQNSKCLEFFLSIPLEEQEEYVWMLLDGRL
ncbi:hypothetical protein ACS0TY_008490 [Phlomoides rotata]